MGDAGEDGPLRNGPSWTPCHLTGLSQRPTGRRPGWPRGVCPFVRGASLQLSSPPPIPIPLPPLPLPIPARRTKMLAGSVAGALARDGMGWDGKAVPEPGPGTSTRTSGARPGALPAGCACPGCPSERGAAAGGIPAISSAPRGMWPARLPAASRGGPPGHQLTASCPPASPCCPPDLGQASPHVPGPLKWLEFQPQP